MRGKVLIVMTAAAIVLIGGSALAASHWIITSTKQIKPSVLRQLRGARGPRGASGPTGAPGPKGDAAAAGQTGSTGAAGSPGASIMTARTAATSGEEGYFAAIGTSTMSSTVDAAVRDEHDPVEVEGEDAEQEVDIAADDRDEPGEILDRPEDHHRAVEGEGDGDRLLAIHVRPARHAPGHALVVGTHRVLARSGPREWVGAHRPAPCSTIVAGF